MERVGENLSGCNNESGNFYCPSTGKNYVCLHKYKEEADIPENSVCFLDSENIIRCINDKYTEIEACKKEMICLTTKLVVKS